jgi:hypothetical protein
MGRKNAELKNNISAHTDRLANREGNPKKISSQHYK